MVIAISKSLISSKPSRYHALTKICWDAYAQSWTNYALTSGAQMAGMHEMITAIAGV